MKVPGLGLRGRSQLPNHPPLGETANDIRAQLAFRRLDVIIQPTEGHGDSKAIVKTFCGRSPVARTTESNKGREHHPANTRLRHVEGTVLLSHLRRNHP